MRISVLGAGTMGRAMAQVLAESGHEVVLGSRSGSAEREVPASKADSGSVVLPVRTYADAVLGSELTVLATTWDRTEATLRAAGNLGDRVLVDCGNPEADDGRSLDIGHVTSGAEMIARWAPTTRVVKAFNHIYAEVVGGPRTARGNVSVFVCGEDTAARDTVGRLAIECGFHTVHVGSLGAARWLEPLAMLIVHLVRVEGLTPHEATLRIAGRDVPRPERR